MWTTPNHDWEPLCRLSLLFPDKKMLSNIGMFTAQKCTFLLFAPIFLLVTQDDLTCLLRHKSALKFGLGVLMQCLSAAKVQDHAAQMMASDTTCIALNLLNFSIYSYFTTTLQVGTPSAIPGSSIADPGTVHNVPRENVNF